MDVCLVKNQVFSSEYRLLARPEFNTVWNLGHKLHTDHFIIVVMKKNSGPTRLGVTASKKVGGAVQRNRVKRLLREFFRSHYGKIDQQVDISIIAKSGSYNLTYKAVCEELKKLLTG